MSACWYDEDDEGQIELLPLANWSRCADMLGEIAEFADAHRAPDGAGWTDAYVRESATVALRSLGLTADQLGAICGEWLPESPVVNVGYGQYAQKAERTRGFGFGYGRAVFFNFGEDGLVEHIWLAVDEMEPAEVQPLVQAAAAIGAQFPLLLVDWGAGDLIALSDRQAVQAYFQRER